jgi:hypothetical protein
MVPVIMRLPPDAPRTRSKRPSRSTIMGVDEDSGRLPPTVESKITTENEKIRKHIFYIGNQTTRKGNSHMKL